MVNIGRTTPDRSKTSCKEIVSLLHTNYSYFAIFLVWPSPSSFNSNTCRLLLHISHLFSPIRGKNQNNWVSVFEPLCSTITNRVKATTGNIQVFSHLFLNKNWIRLWKEFCGMVPPHSSRVNSATQEVCSTSDHTVHGVIDFKFKKGMIVTI